MAKKKKSKCQNLLYVAALVLGVVAICMIFVDSVSVDVILGTVTYTGLQTTFGYATEYVTYFSFSILNLIPYLLALCAVIMLALRLTKNTKAKTMDWLAVVAFAVAAVLFFVAPSLVVSELYKNATKALATGTIISAVSALCAGAAVAVKALRK